MDSSENPLKALETFIKNSSTPKPSNPINESFTKSAPKFYKEEKYRLLDSSELQLEDFLENMDSQMHQQQQQQYEEYYDDSESYNEEMEEEYSPPSSYPSSGYQQRFSVNFNFNLNKIDLDEIEQQQRQRKRNEEIARILSPIQKLKVILLTKCFAILKKF